MINLLSVTHHHRIPFPREIEFDNLFDFNPNSLDDNGWSALGLSEGKLKVLRNYQNSGHKKNQK